jgi:two-component system response regulator YesN
MYKAIIIDDEPWTILDIEQTFALKDMGFEIIGSFRSPLKALPAIMSKKPELIITDIRMPGMTGLELIQKVRAQHLNCEFIIVSGYNDFAYAKEAIAYGVTGYCLKPLDPAETAACLERARTALNRRSVLPSDSPYIDDTFERILNHMNTHFPEKLSLKSLAAAFDLNPNYCCTLFTKYLGKTFSQHLTELRITEAQSLLKTTAHSLEKIAQMVGYNDYFYFSKVFKKHCSYSPKEYRRQFYNIKESDS